MCGVKNLVDPVSVARKGKRRLSSEKDLVHNVVVLTIFPTDDVAVCKEFFKSVHVTVI